MEEIIIRSKLDISDSEKGVDKLDKSIDKIDKSVGIKSESMTKALNSVSTSATSLVGAYTAVSSATILMNGNQSKATETLTKLMAVQNIAVGIQQVANSLIGENNILVVANNTYTKISTALQKAYSVAVGKTTGAMKLLRLAMLALPILLIIAGVTALVTWLVKLSDSSKKLKEANDNLTKSYEKQKLEMQALGKVQERQAQRELELAELQGKSEEELQVLRVNLLNEREKNRRKELQAETDMLNSLNEQYSKSLKTKNKELQNNLKEQIERTKENQNKLILEGEEFQHQIRVSGLKHTAKVQEIEDKANEERLRKQQEWNDKKLREQEEAKRKEIELQTLMEDLLLINIEDDNERKEAQILTNFEREKQRITEAYGEQTELIKQLEIQRDNELQQLRNSIQEQADEKQKEYDDKERNAQHELEKLELNRKLQNLENDFEAEMEIKQQLAELERDFLLQNDELTANERLLIAEQYNAELEDLTRQRAKNEEAIEKAKTQAIKSVSNALLSGLLENMEEGTNAYKAIAITQTTISTIQSAIEAFKSMAGIPYVGPILGGLAAAAATASGIAAVRKISAMKVSAKGGGGGTPSAPRYDISGLQNANSVQSGATDTSDVIKSPQQESTTQQVVILQSEIEASQKESNYTKVLSRG